MSTALVYLGVLLTTATSASVYLWYKRPGVLLKILFRLLLYRCGLRRHFVRGSRYVYCYGVRGKKKPGQPTLVFVHGFSSSKDMYTNIISRLPHDQHIVVVDLPGHGDSSIPHDNDELSLFMMVDSLHELLELVGVNKEPFHLIGASLGGALAALYACIYPDHIAKVSLMCPAMKTPVQTEFMRNVDEGSEECVLLPTTPQAIHTMMSTCMYHKHKVPRNPQFHKGILQLRAPKHAFHRRLFDQLTDEAEKHDREMKHKFRGILAPTHLMWGAQDELIHVSGMDELKELLPNITQTDLLENCGHSISMDQPELATQCLLKFIRSPLKQD